MKFSSLLDTFDEFFQFIHVAIVNDQSAFAAGVVFDTESGVQFLLDTVFQLLNLFQVIL